MSKKLRRWDIECTGIGDDVDMVERPKGNYVLMEDYARLKAEVERLTERNKFLEQIDSYLQGANENAYEKRCDELEAEVERLGEENKKRQKDMELLFASYKQALEDIRRLHWDLQTAKEGKQP